MTDLIPSLASLSGRYRALFCDLWGCLHNGESPFPEAVAALRAFRAEGGRVVLLTNAPRPHGRVIAQLDRLAVPRDAWDLVVSSGDAAQYALVTGAVGHKVYHLGPDKDESFFTEISDELRPLLERHPPVTRVPLDQAEGIVCTGLFDDLTETPEDYRATLLYARTKGLKMLCTNPDIVVDMGDKRVYCAGALAQAYEADGGEALYFGKPHPPIYDLARRKLAALAGALPDEDILCVGDGILTDVRGGQAEGLDTLFILSGLATGNFGPDDDYPDPSRLTAWLQEQGQAPTFAIGRLR
jgi:HAD superfamily hydrolase (TIGR01459 family)